MKIASNHVVTLDFHVTDPDGDVIDAGEEPIVYLHGGYGSIFEKLEDALEGKSVGDRIQIKLEPEDAFGDYDDELIQVESLDVLPPGIEVGMHFEGVPENGDDDEEILIFRVTDIADGKAVLDANHPCAGMAIVFTATVTAIRPASKEEIDHGHAHDGDHDHEGQRHRH